MAEMPSQTAERVHLQWNEGWHTWQEVLPQYARKRGVVTFIRADLVDDLVKALEEAREALSVFAAFSDKAERFVDHKVKFGGAAIFPVKDFRLSHFRRAVEVVALIDTLLPGDAP